MTDNERILTARNKRLEEENKEAWETIGKLLAQHHTKDAEYEEHIGELRCKNIELRDELEKRNTAEILYFKETIRLETKNEVTRDILGAIRKCLTETKKTIDDVGYVPSDAIEKVIRNIEEIMVRGDDNG